MKLAFKLKFIGFYLVVRPEKRTRNNMRITPACIERLIAGMSKELFKI